MRRRRCGWRRDLGIELSQGVAAVRPRAIRRRRDTDAGGAPFDRLEDGERLVACPADRRVEGKGKRDGGQVGGHDGRAARRRRGAASAWSARSESSVPMNGKRIFAGAGAARRAPAAPVHHRRDQAIPGQQRGERDEDVPHAHRESPFALARSATIRRSTPGSRRSRCSVSGSAKPPKPAALRRRAHQDVGRAALARDARDDVGRSSPSSTSTARRGASPTGAARRAAPPRPARVAPGREHGEDVELGPEPLRRAPGAPHDPLGGGLRRDDGQQPLADGLRDRVAHHAVLVAHRRRLAHEPLGLDALGDLAQRDLAQRLEVLEAEEAVQGGRDALGLVDLARRRRSISAGGVTSTSTTSSAAESTESGNVSRTRTPVSSAT